MKIIDISFPIADRMEGFPGDPAVRVRRVRAIERGAAYNLSALSLSSHTATHVDPPVHFLAGGSSIDKVDLSALNGPVWVSELPPGASSVGPDAVRRVPAKAERVLFRTRNSERWRESSRFFSDYVAVDLAGAEELLARGVRLVGIDSFSVESDATGTFPVHHRLLGAGALILEGLRLGEVPEGGYELRCLPLLIAGGDGGPCRAILLEA